MAVPRPVLLGIVGGVLILAALVATRLTGGGDETSTTPAPATKQAAGTPAPASHPAGATKPSKSLATASKKSADRRAGLPAAVSSALAKHTPVVLFFSQKGGADDAATRVSVGAMQRRLQGKVKVVADSLSNIDDYSLVVRGLGIDQAPSIAIIDKGKRARVIGGYVDEGTLTQEVRDATR